MALPLEGIKVIDLSSAQLGPFAAQMMAELGADVIKVEPREGEFLRSVTREWDNSSLCNYFLAFNRSKRGIAVNIKKPKGQEVVRKLAAKADVLIENQLGSLDRLGLGYDDLCKINPKIIYCHISAYGRKGPLSQTNGYDIIVAGQTGLTSYIGEKGSPPYPLAHSVLDQHGASQLLAGILLALRVRDTQGIGQEVDVNLIMSSFALQDLELQVRLSSGKPLRKGGTGIPMVRGLYRIFPAKDGWVIIGGTGERHWPRMVEVFGDEALANDPRFATADLREAHATELIPILNRLFSTRPAMEWVNALRPKGVPIGEVRDYERMLADPEFVQQIEENQFLVDMDTPGNGKIKVIGLPIKFSKTPGRIRSMPPQIGQHTNEVLGELGYSWEEVAGMVSEEVI